METLNLFCFVNTNQNASLVEIVEQDGDTYHESSHDRGGKRCQFKETNPKRIVTVAEQMPISLDPCRARFWRSQPIKYEPFWKREGSVLAAHFDVRFGFLTK